MREDSKVIAAGAVRHVGEVRPNFQVVDQHYADVFGLPECKARHVHSGAIIGGGDAPGQIVVRVDP